MLGDRVADGVSVDKGGVSRLEGIGMEEINDGTGEPRDPDMLSILSDKTRSENNKRRETWTHVKKEEYSLYGPLSTGLTEVKFT